MVLCYIKDANDGMLKNGLILAILLPELSSGFKIRQWKTIQLPKLYLYTMFWCNALHKCEELTQEHIFWEVKGYEGASHMMYSSISSVCC